MKEETQKFLEKIQDRLIQDYSEHINSAAHPPLMTEAEAYFIDAEIYHGKYVFFVGRVGNIWILETESGHRFTIKYLQQDDVESPYDEGTEYMLLDLSTEKVEEFYRKHYKIDENSIKFNLDYLPDEIKEHSTHQGQTLHMYQPIRITRPGNTSKEALIAMPGKDDAVVMYMFNFEIVSEEELNQDKEFLCWISEKYAALRKMLEVTDWEDEEMLTFIRENNVSEKEFEIYQHLLFKETEVLYREAEYHSKLSIQSVPEKPKRRNDKPEVGPLMEMIFDELADFSSEVTGVSSIKDEYNFLGYDKVFLSEYHTLSLQRLEGDKIYQTTLSGNKAGDMFTTFKCEVFENLQLIETINVSKRKIPKELRKAGDILENSELFGKMMELIFEEHINFLKQ